MRNNYLLVHGSFGSPFSNWIPYLRKEIESKRFRSIYSRFSNRSWLSKL